MNTNSLGLQTNTKNVSLFETYNKNTVKEDQLKKLKEDQLKKIKQDQLKNTMKEFRNELKDFKNILNEIKELELLREQEIKTENF